MAGEDNRYPRDMNGFLIILKGLTLQVITLLHALRVPTIGIGLFCSRPLASHLHARLTTPPSPDDTITSIPNLNPC